MSKMMYKVFNMVNGEMQEILFPTKELSEEFIKKNPDWHMNKWTWQVTIED